MAVTAAAACEHAPSSWAIGTLPLPRPPQIYENARPHFKPHPPRRTLSKAEDIQAANGGPAYSKLSDILITKTPPGASQAARDAAARAAAAAALKYDPSNEELRRMGAQAAEWNVDISPNLYDPLQLNLEGCLDMAMLPPDDELAAWLTDLGRKDTRLWARLWGVGGGQR